MLCWGYSMQNHEKHLVTNVTVIIRSVGERTEAVCRSLVEQQIPGELVVTIHERPFSKAVQRTFEIGLDFNRDWTLALDADVLLRQNSIAEFISAIELTADNLFCFNGMVWDK